MTILLWGELADLEIISLPPFEINPLTLPYLKQTYSSLKCLKQSELSYEIITVLLCFSIELNFKILDFVLTALFFFFGRLFVYPIHFLVSYIKKASEIKSSNYFRRLPFDPVAVSRYFVTNLMSRKQISRVLVKVNKNRLTSVIKNATSSILFKNKRRP